MGFLGLEMDATTEAPLRPLIGMQVWLYGSKKASDWIIAMAPRVAEVSPEGLYVQWIGMPHDEPSQIIVPNKYAKPGASFDLYDIVRLTGGLDPDDEERAERIGSRLSSLLRALAEPQEQPIKPVAKADPPKAPAAAKPWWDQ